MSSGICLSLSAVFLARVHNDMMDRMYLNMIVSSVTTGVLAGAGIGFFLRAKYWKN